MKIVVVGAQGTGKTRLVEALRLELGADADAAVCAVTEGGAPDQHQRYDLTLLMGLDLPAQGQAQDSHATQYDTHLRQLLDQHAITYAVVYGTGQARTDCALQAIAYHRNQSHSKRPRPAASAWQWCCDTCSDADCEHRLFTALVNKPAASVRA